MHERLTLAKHSERETENAAVRLAPEITLCESSQVRAEPPSSRPLPCGLQERPYPFLLYVAEFISSVSAQLICYLKSQ